MSIQPIGHTLRLLYERYCYSGLRFRSKHALCPTSALAVPAVIYARLRWRAGGRDAPADATQSCEPAGAAEHSSSSRGCQSSPSCEQTLVAIGTGIIGPPAAVGTAHAARRPEKGSLVAESARESGQRTGIDAPPGGDRATTAVSASTTKPAEPLQDPAGRTRPITKARRALPKRDTLGDRQPTRS